MILWKQRLYAFLLRRILGPILDKASLQKLHESIDVSFHEGTFALKDIALCTTYLNEVLSNKTNNKDSKSLRIRSARVERLRIQLKLREHATDVPGDNDADEMPSSLAWRAMKLGTNVSYGLTPSVSLVAEVEVDGVLLELEPNCEPEQARVSKQTTATMSGSSEVPAEESSVKSMLSSYIDAAMSSLSLTVKVDGFVVKLRAGTRVADPCLEMRLQSACYHDVEIQPSHESKALDYKTIMHKALDVGRVTVLIGDPSSQSILTTIALLEAGNKIRVRAIEYNLPRDPSSVKGTDRKRVQHDVEVNLNQRLNLSIDAFSLLQLKQIARCVTPAPCRKLSPVETTAARTIPEVDSEGSLDQAPDEEDLGVISGIMKQYQEARLLAERNEVRGGILVPSTTDDNESGDGFTFDAFFDANEQSFYHYSTVLRESLAYTKCEDEAAQKFVHTKIRFHLTHCCIKLSFREQPPPLSDHILNRAPDSYILMTLSDLGMSSSLSLRNCQHDLSVAHLDIEDSQVEFRDISGLVPRRVAIGSILRFPPDADGPYGLEESDLLLQAPCISLSARAEHGEIGLLEIEMSIQPVELSYRHATVSNLAELLRVVGSSHDCVRDVEGESSGGPRKSASKKVVKLNGSCGSLTLMLPLIAEKEWNNLYNRCGFFFEGSPSKQSSLGVLLDNLSFEVNTRASGPDENVSISCNHILAYTTSPTGNSSTDRLCRYFDIIALSGRTEVNPCIPVRLKLWNNHFENEDHDCTNCPAAKLFPQVAAISSFKARQQDEDEDNADRVLSSNLQDLKDLRENDRQSSMLAETTGSDYVVELNIPELVGDITSSELLMVMDMLACVFPPSNKGATAQPTGPTETAALKRLAFACSCDFMSFALHGDIPSIGGGCEPHSFSYLLKTDRFKTHVLLNGPTIRHIRALAQEVDFFEVTDLVRSAAATIPLPHAGRRVKTLFERGTRSSWSVATPLFYRSHLFTPISRQSPSMLFDLMNLSNDSRNGRQDLSHKNVYVTLYDSTYRYVFESRWLERFNSILAQVTARARESASRSEADPPQSLVRFFLSVADCNLDYSTPLRFETSSRVIIRVGDFRLSSNIILPAAPIQAFSLSLGDVSVYLCNRRYPYNFENANIPRASTIMKQDEISLTVFRKPWSVNSEVVLGLMNYRSILIMDSLDAVIAMTRSSPELVSEPKVRCSVNVGEVGLYACKDSLACLVGSLGELSTELTALDENALAELKLKNPPASEAADGMDGSLSDESTEPDNVMGSKPRFYGLDALKEKSALRPSSAPPRESDEDDGFLLDGYDWTAIDLDESSSPRISPDEEQSARWYGIDGSSDASDDENEEIGYLPGHDASDNDNPVRSRRTARQNVRIVTNHFSLQPEYEPLGEGDMDAARYAGTTTSPQVKCRLLVHDLRVKVRLFDGFDWPAQLSVKSRGRLRTRGAFVIDALQSKTDDLQETVDGKCMDYHARAELEHRAQLMGDLLQGSSDNSSTFEGMPLPEERGALLKEQAELRRLARRTDKYCQFSLDGVSVRLDSMEDCDHHRLVSCLSLSVRDFFVAETISNDRPVKMLGEWANDVEHPRCTSEGLCTMKMATWHPSTRVSADNEIVNDECEALVRLLPLRCLLDQRAIRFIKTFFASDKETVDSDLGDGSLPPGIHAVPPPHFRLFRVAPARLKVDYVPQKFDRKALRDGAIVELVNLTPIDAMVLTLQQVDIENVVGFGEVASTLVGCWVQDICATQLVKFLTNSRPFEPITHIGGAATDMMVVPYQAFKYGGSIGTAIKLGTASFAKAVVFEACSTTSRLAGYVADKTSKSTDGGSMLPSRPCTTPREMYDTVPHAMESLSRGVQEANYKVVIVPYREFRRNGTTGAVKSVLKGIPVALAAPAGGAAEALSYTMLGARNYVRPDIRKEEEASQRGLRWER